MTPIKLGITGGIGSGKTVVCRILEQLGIPVYYADTESKRILENQPDVIARIKELLGSDAYHPDGKANRSLIAALVFNHPEKLKQLNNILHPAVRNHFMDWASEFHDKPIIAKEAAIIFESGSYLDVDRVAVVTAPEPLRIRRVMARDQRSEADIRMIMSRQLPETEAASRSDFVIVNDDEHLVIPQVLAMVEQLAVKKRTGNDSTPHEPE